LLGKCLLEEVSEGVGNGDRRKWRRLSVRKGESLSLTLEPPTVDRQAVIKV
jgi:hypothetical protein